jgi:hypothetical protein
MDGRQIFGVPDLTPELTIDSESHIFINNCFLNLRWDNSKMKLKCGGKDGFSQMVNWQLTATTIYCDAVDDEVTVMVYKDWSTRCTGFNKYTGKDKVTGKRQSRQTEHSTRCEGLECARVIQYVNKLKAEEKVGYADVKDDRGTGSN